MAPRDDLVDKLKKVMYIWYINNLEDILTELRDHLARAVSTLDRALQNRDQPPPPGADLPSVDLSHLSVRKAIQNWLELLPNKRTASPAEIKKGLKAARPSMNDNQDTIQQSIYELAKEGKIRRDGWGQYGAKVSEQTPADYDEGLVVDTFNPNHPPYVVNPPPDRSTPASDAYAQRALERVLAENKGN